MNKIWNNKWKKILLWASGYLSFVAYALVGGYAIVKETDDEIKKTAKSVLVVTLIFTAFSIFLSVISNLGSLVDGYYSSSFYEFYKVLNALVSVAKCFVYAFMVVWELVKKEPDKQAHEKKDEK